MRYYLSFMAACLLIIGYQILHDFSSSQPVSLDDLYQQQLAEFQRQSGAGSRDDDAAFFLRNLVYRDDSVEFAALWERGERVFPSPSGMMTWAESGLLTELLPVMNAVRANPVLQWQRLYLSTGPAWVNCSTIADEMVVCLAFSERGLNSDGVMLPINRGAFGSWLIIVLGMAAALMILMLHTRLRWLRNRLDEIVHDLRLPLANIGLYLTLLRRNAPNVLPQTQMDLLEFEQRRAVQLAECLLESTDLRSLPYTVFFLFRKKNLLTHADIQDRLRSRIAAWEPALANANVRVSVEYSSNSLHQVVHGGSCQLMRILDNLLDNSCRHSPGGLLHIWLVSSSDGLELRWLSERASDHQHAAMRWRTGIGLRSFLWQVRLNGWCSQQWQEGGRYRLVIGMPWVSTARSPGFGADECHV